MTTKEQKPQLTAAQRIQALEQAIGILDQTIYNMSRQNDTMREALALLNDKLSAVVTALSTGVAVSDESLNSIVEATKVEDMKKKVQNLLETGRLMKAEQITDNSFLVVREVNSETGKVVNPRLQFVSKVLNQESLQKILGKKAGDSVKFVEDNPAIIEIEEIYEIVNKENREELLEQQEAQA